MFLAILNLCSIFFFFFLVQKVSRVYPDELLEKFLKITSQKFPCDILEKCLKYSMNISEKNAYIIKMLQFVENPVSLRNADKAYSRDFEEICLDFFQEFLQKILKTFPQDFLNKFTQ